MMVTDPIFWLGLSLGCVALGLLTLCLVLLPILQDVQRAVRSIERLAETLTRELPPTLESFRRTGVELGDLTENMNDGVRSASDTLEQIHEGVTTVRRQTQRVHGTARGIFAGVRTAWQVLRQGSSQEIMTAEPRVLRDRKLEREPRYRPEDD